MEGVERGVKGNRMREERRNDRARFPAVGRGELAECIGRVLSEGCRERKSKK